MKILQLPFWNFLKELFESKFKYLKFDTWDYSVFILLAICALVAIGLIFMFIFHVTYEYFDEKTAIKKILSGELLDKKYISEWYFDGTGEDFFFFIKADKVYKIEVDMQQFYSKNIGEKVRFEVTIGVLTGNELDVNLS